MNILILIVLFFLIIHILDIRRLIKELNSRIDKLENKD